jgi:hypothetical protein
MGLAQFGRGGRGLCRVEIENDRPPAVQGEQLGDGPADAALRGGPGNHADLVSKKHFPTFCKMLSLAAALHVFTATMLGVALRALKTVFDQVPNRRAESNFLRSVAQMNNNRYC